MYPKIALLTFGTFCFISATISSVKIFFHSFLLLCDFHHDQSIHHIQSRHFITFTTFAAAQRLCFI